MDKELTRPQQAARLALLTNGSIKKGDGHSLSTARALERRGLATLEERRDASDKVYFWRARHVEATPAAAPAPPAPAPVEDQPHPAGAWVIRIGVRNPDTEQVTYTEIRHPADEQALREELSLLGVPDSAHPYQTVHTTERWKLSWRPLAKDALKEFVWGGQVYRLQRDRQFGGWQVLHLATQDVVAAGNDPVEVERRACADAAAFNHATRGGTP